MSGWDPSWYERSRPVAVKGGIKAQAGRGEFGKSWWAKRWIEALQSFGYGSRLTRGRTYARQGQVISIDVGDGVVDSKVQGSRDEPYTVKIGVKPIATEGWNKVIEALSGQALYAARLLSGEMPADIEDAFKDAGVSLFPAAAKDLETDCSCPDYANPCKHIAAVYYLLGEEFDRDPFLIFTLRGLSRDALMSRLAGASKTTPDSPPGEPALPPQPLTTNASTFWNGEPLPADLFGEVRRPPVDAAVALRLGSIPFWRSETPFMDTMKSDYAEASARGLAAFVGE